MLYPLTLAGGHVWVWVTESRCGMDMTGRQSQQSSKSIGRACSADTEQSALNKSHSQSQHNKKTSSSTHRARQWYQ
jgi:hypothetical protein